MLGFDLRRGLRLGASSAGLAMAAALVLLATSARADIEIKAGCDGKWVEKTAAGFDSYYVCRPSHRASPAEAHPRASGETHHRIAHAKPAHRPNRPAAPAVRVAMAIPPDSTRRECLAFTCPQFLLTGVGY